MEFDNEYIRKSCYSIHIGWLRFNRDQQKKDK